MGNSPEILSASTVLGNKVKNPQGEDLGKVEELIIDPDTGRIVGALLSRTDGLKDAELSQIPWEALTLSKEDGGIYVDDEIMQHPFRRAKDWPETGEPPHRSHNVVVYTSSVYKGSGGA